MILGALYDEYLKLRAKNLKARLNEDKARPWRLLDETEQAQEAAECEPLLKDAEKGPSANKEADPADKQSE